MASKQWIDYKKTLGRQLTDNVKANEVMSPVYFLLALYILTKHYNFVLIGKNFFSGGIFYALVSTLIYVFASNYYQPDLDVRYNRPGMGHFPLGRWVGKFKLGRVLKSFLYPVNRLWFYLWKPYAKVLTHRGVGHWPILGVLLRTTYLYIFFMLGEYIFMKTVGKVPFEYGAFGIWLEAFYPWNKNFATIFFLLFCFPIYISDTVHWMVDYYDSAKRGLSFCPPKIPRGLIAEIINHIMGRKSL